MRCAVCLQLSFETNCFEIELFLHKEWIFLYYSEFIEINKHKMEVTNIYTRADGSLYYCIIVYF